MILKQNKPIVPLDKVIVVQLSPNPLSLCKPKFIIKFTEPPVPMDPLHNFTPYFCDLLFL